ncbi:MAG: amidohydrolase family protein [Niabella sp.]
MYKKIKSKQLFDGFRFRPDEVLILNENDIVEDIVSAADAGEDVLTVEGIVSPGFINCHCHLELSHLKGKIEEATGLTGFVGRVVANRQASAEIIENAIEESEREMIKNGIVAVGDICNTADTVVQKSKANLYYHNFIEVLGFDPANAEANFDQYSSIKKIFYDALPAEQVSFSPHAPYSVSAPLWQMLLDAEKKLITIHNQETTDENLLFENKTGAFVDLYKKMNLNAEAFMATGKSSLQSYLPKFNAGQQLILVHNVHTSEKDILFTKVQPVHISWCFCPAANEYISRQLPDITLFVKNNCSIVLGTDSLASNHQLSIWNEIEIIQKKFPHISLEMLLKWGTSNGAKALGISGRYGSFEKGKKPGVLKLNEDAKPVLL